MSNATAEKKDQSVRDRVFGSPSATGDLPLKGGKDSVTKGLDGKTVIKSPEDPKVVAAANEYAKALDRMENLRQEANEKGQVLLELFLGSKKVRKVRVITDAKTYYFSTATLTKIVTEKKQSVN